VKLKVGDIEMDSTTGVSFDGAPASPVDNRSDYTSSSLQQRLPDWSRLTYAALAALCIAACVGAVVATISLADNGSTFWLLPTIPAPGLVFVTGLFVWGALVGDQQAAQDGDLDALAMQRCERIMAHLASRESPASVEQLIGELGWSEEAVVNGLDAGVRQDRIEEDLDLQTGQWGYAAASEQPGDSESRKVLPIDERAAQLEDNGSKKPQSVFTNS
jgi:hypothetical protein